MSTMKRNKFRSKRGRLLCFVLSLALITAVPLSAPLSASATSPGAAGSGTESGSYPASTAANPEIVKVVPSGNEVALKGNIVVTFSKSIAITGDITLTSAALGDGEIRIDSGSLDASGKIYTVPYGGLSHNVTYVINISGFKDADGNEAITSGKYSFTTVKVPVETITVPGPGGNQQIGGSNDVSKAKIFFGSANAVLVRSVPYTGKAVTPPVRVVFDGKTLQYGKDYALTFANNIKIGKAKVTIIGAGAYKGASSATFNILPTKLKIKKLNVSKKNKGLMRVHWKAAPKSQKITKYQLRYRVKGTKKWKFKTLKAKAKSLTLKKLKGKKRYQVQIRSYKTISNVKYYSPWSAVKLSKKIKK